MVSSLTQLFGKSASSNSLNSINREVDNIRDIGFLLMKDRNYGNSSGQYKLYKFSISLQLYSINWLKQL